MENSPLFFLCTRHVILAYLVVNLCPKVTNEAITGWVAILVRKLTSLREVLPLSTEMFNSLPRGLCGWGSYRRLRLGNSNGKWVGKGKKMPKGWWGEGLGRHYTYKYVVDHWNRRTRMEKAINFWKLLSTWNGGNFTALLGSVKTTHNRCLKLPTLASVCYGLFYLMIALGFCECMRCCVPQVELCLVQV